jgi:hypothetical protein
MRLLLSWPYQVLAILASMYLNMQIAALLFFAGVPFSLTTRFIYAPLGLYCVLNFGVPLVILLSAIMGSETRNNRLMLAENGMAIRLLRGWKTQNMVLFLTCLTTFVVLRVVADIRIAAIVRALGQ